jgi:hypothetical protein
VIGYSSWSTRLDTMTSTFSLKKNELGMEVENIISRLPWFDP